MHDFGLAVAIMSNDSMKPDRTWTEQIVVSGNRLVERVKQLLAEGNVRRLIIRKPSGEKLLEMPLTAGVAVGGLMTIIVPVLTVLSVLAALVAEVKVEVVRTGEPHQD